MEQMKGNRPPRESNVAERADCVDTFLRSLPPLLGAGDEALDEVKRLLTKKYLTRGKTVYLGGDPVAELYFVEAGRIEVSKMDANGRRLTLWYIGPGEAFCVPSVLTGRAVADAEAVEDSVLYCLAKEHFEDLLGRFPELAVGFLKCLAGRIHGYSRSVDAVAFGSASVRVADVLLKYADPDRKGRPVCRLSRGEITSLVGACRETVSRALSGLKKEGLIALEPGCVVVRSAEGLRSKYGKKA
jgi:CRP/FNR family transcriptional regulator